MKLRRTLLLLIMGLAAVGFALPAAATAAAMPMTNSCTPNYPYPPGASCALAVSATAVTPGSAFIVSAKTYCPNQPVTFALASPAIKLGSLSPGSNGVVTGTVRVPSSYPIGAHVVSASGQTCVLGEHFARPLTLTAQLKVVPAVTVAAALPAVSTGLLPFTGLEVGLGAAGLAVLAIVVGALLVAIFRRRAPAPQRAQGRSR